MMGTVPNCSLFISLLQCRTRRQSLRMGEMAYLVKNPQTYTKSQDGSVCL